MKRVAAAGAWVVGVLLAQLTLGQALRPQVVPEDRSTPRGTLKVLKTAMEKGDADQLRSILTPTNDSERGMVDAMVQTAVSVRQLHDAAVTVFGVEAAKALTGEPKGPGPDGLTDLDKATEAITEDGKTATVSFADIDATPLKLTRQGEQWQVPVAELGKDPEPAALTERLGEVQTLNRIVDEIAKEVAEKKYKTAEEARQALYNKLMQSAPSTRPTTQAAR